jgi:hypothetical protein
MLEFPLSGDSGFDILTDLERAEFPSTGVGDIADDVLDRKAKQGNREVSGTYQMFSPIRSVANLDGQPSHDVHNSSTYVYGLTGRRFEFLH